MNKTQILSLWLTFIIATIVPTMLFAQSNYSCDCAADTLNCSDFASPADAQACFWNCGAQGVGDIHQLDRDMNAVACDVLAEPTAVPTPVTVYAEPAYAEPAYVEPAYAEPTPVPTMAMPTAVPAYEVCSCGGDYYDCNTFSGPAHAQGCYDYCAAQGLGDVHLMDPDEDGLACQTTAAIAPTVVFVAPAPTPEPVYVAPTPVQPTPVPTAVPASITPFVGILDNPAACSCDGDSYNCNNFATQNDSQACFWHCGAQGAGDIHRLDQGGIKGVTCEEYSGFAPVLPAPLPFETVAGVAGASCVCDFNQYNCSDFTTHGDAQACFDTCRAAAFGDIHGLDQDNDLIACEGLLEAERGY